MLQSFKDTRSAKGFSTVMGLLDWVLKLRNMSYKVVCNCKQVHALLNSILEIFQFIEIFEIS